MMMNITIIHGSQRRGNTEKTIEIAKNRLSTYDDIKFHDLYLPKDLPLFCVGCFSCLHKGTYAGEYCPHAKYTHPILETLKISDGIIITSPVYALSESGQIKAFLDHYACIFISHKPIQEMFSKTALVISTTYGAGTNYVIKTIVRNIKFWGIAKIFKCGLNLFADNWDDMTIKNRNKNEKFLEKKIYGFYNSIKRKRYHIPLRTKILFIVFRIVMKRHPDGNKDKEYWKEKGWLDKKRPW